MSNEELVKAIEALFKDLDFGCGCCQGLMAEEENREQIEQFVRELRGKL